MYEQDNTIFNDIKGLGPSRIKIIWKNYNSIEDILKNTDKEVHDKTKIPIGVIQNMFQKLKQIKK